MKEAMAQKQEKRPTKQKQKQALKKLKDKLEAQQLAVKEKKLPVLVLLEGWGASGKGDLLRSIISCIDPRFFSVEVMETAPTEEEKRMPFMYRYMKALPEGGEFAFLEAGWMTQLLREKLALGMEEDLYQERLQSVRIFERQLEDNGYLVLKFFLSIGEQKQKARLKKMEENPETAWRVSRFDRWQNKNYSRYEKAAEDFMESTHTPSCPWYQIDGEKRKKAQFQVLSILTQAIDKRLAQGAGGAPVLEDDLPVIPPGPLREVELDKRIGKKEYKEKLRALQERLGELHNILYLRKIPVVILYEGWDASGKGGNIKRVAKALDPRGYRVIPIASPRPWEKNRYYLWRFWVRLQRSGHVTIFDRSWYGRVMVERIEGFCSEKDWRRAYREINEFERELVNWGAIVLKFWLQIDSKTQLERFEERQRDPRKQWKITEEDWRNRKKWSAYEGAVDQMLEKTSTAYAPWHLIPSVDKKYARIETLERIIQAVEKRLKQAERR